MSGQTISSPIEQSQSQGTSRFTTGFRPDIQGMRAIAVLLVLLFHAGVPFLSGGFVGVDMFFVLSGYLITGIMLSEVERTSAFRITTFYAKRVIRIIPAATVVLIATGIASWLWVPVTQWRSIGQEIIGSAMYVSNWQFAASTNYLNAEAPPSPLQHFWSLAVEEQFYIIWPLIVVCIVVLVRKAKLVEHAPAYNASSRVLRILFLAMGLLTIVSFAFSLLAMRFWPEAAYFITPTRIWELGIGGLLAFATPMLRELPRRVRRAAMPIGLLMIAFAAVGYSSATSFPGASALLPTLGMALMLTGGIARADEHLPHPVLAHPVAQWFGNISYSLYLWHWPILVIAAAAFGPLSVWTQLALLVIAVAFAWMSTVLLENPIRRWRGLRTRPAKAGLLGLCSILISALTACALLFAFHSNAQSDANASAPGAAAIPAGGEPARVQQVPEDLVPNLALASDDNPTIYAEGCHLEVAETVPRECHTGEGDTVLLVGDSHAAQWYPTLQQLSAERGFRLVSMTKSSCPVIDLEIELSGKDKPYTECAAWNDEIQKYIRENPPELVVTTSLERYQVVGRVSNDEDALASGFRSSWDTIGRSEVPVLVLADTPYMASNVPDCIAANSSNPQECATDRTTAFLDHGVLSRAEQSAQGVTYVDLNSRICPGDQCEPIIGGVLVYRDAHHLSATYARTLAEDFENAVGDLLPARS